MSGAKKFANPARDGLAKEVVALANAYGGVVVVGVDETDDHPKRARGPDLVLVQRIAACAEQLQQAFESLIDPPLPVLEVRVAVLTAAGWLATRSARPAGRFGRWPRALPSCR